MLDSTVDSVNSALKRARSGLQTKLPSDGSRLATPASDSPSQDAVVARFVAAYEHSDLDSLVALLTDDVFVSMPPLPFEYQGRDPACRFFASIFASGRKFHLLRTRANGQPAVGAYVRGPAGISRGVGLFVITLAGDEICAMTRFENTVLPWFGLPRSLPASLAGSGWSGAGSRCDADGALAAVEKVCDDQLDPALLRGGRLSRTIVLGLPDEHRRLAILRLYAARMPTVGVSLEELARRTAGFAPADLKALCQEAGLAAMLRGAEARVSEEDFENAINRVRPAAHEFAT
jgi:hypothetical protein